MRAGRRAQLQQVTSYGNHYRSDCVICGQQAGNVININGSSITTTLHRLGPDRTEYIWAKHDILLNAKADLICNVCCERSLDELLENGIHRKCDERIIDNFNGNRKLIANMRAFLTAPSLKSAILAQHQPKQQQQQRLVAASVSQKQCERLTNMNLNQLDGIATFALQQMGKRNISYGAAVGAIDKQPVSDKKIVPVVVDRNDEDDEKNAVDDDELEDDVSVCTSSKTRYSEFVFSKLYVV